MSNSSFNSTLSLLTTDVFLDALGFNSWLLIISTFVMPVISLIGAILCSLSAFIFLQSKFKDPVFFYYQLLCLVYIVHLIHNIPHGLLFSPRYYPQMDTYWSSAFQIYYATISGFLYNYEDVLQMAILLTRMKIFSPFIRIHFTASPKILSFFLLLQ